MYNEPMFSYTFRRVYRRRVVRRKKRSRPEYVLKKEHARALVLTRLDFFVGQFAALDPVFREKMKWGRVAVRDQRSRWGSCSAKKNLNFNFRLFDLPPHLRDYVVVHELCHLVELNHAAAFWELVERIMPDARALQAELRKIHIPR
jgi:hypothetical protein